MNFKQLCQDLEAKIKSSYEDGVSVVEAERLAGEFLYAQMAVSKELKSADLDARMRKSGLKAVRASIYMEAATKTDKKPSDTLLDNLVTGHEIVQSEQKAYDQAEITLAELNRYYDIFREAHIFFRGISKGRLD